MSGVSDPFLGELRKLVAAFEELEDRWTVFWSRYEEARRQRGVWFPDLGPKWNDFQSAFRKAAHQTLECRQGMPKPEELPRLFTGWPPGWAIAATFPELLKLFAEKFSAWLPGVMDPKGGFAEWNWNTDFSRDFMGQFRPLFIVPLEQAIRVYERFFAQREAQRLAEALASQEIAPQTTASPPVSVPLVVGAQETSPGPTTTQSGPTTSGHAEVTTPQSPVELDGFLGGLALADALGVHPQRRDAFFKRLERERMSIGDENWKEITDKRPNEPRFLYRLSAVRKLAAKYRKPPTPP